MSVFLVDLRAVKRRVRGGITVQPIPNMVNHETNEVFSMSWRSRRIT